MQAENDGLKSKLNESLAASKKATGERDTALKTLETESLVTINMQRERDLTEGLSAAGVTNAINLKAAKAMLAAQVTVVTDGDKRITKVGDKPLADYLKEWGASDEGKHFIAAPNNSGGGSQGGGGNGQSNQTLTSTQKIAAGLAKL